MSKLIFALSFMLILSGFGFAQKQKTEPVTDGGEAAKPAAKTTDSPQNEDFLLKSGTNLEAQLESVLDVKRSKPGDTVILKTTKAVKQNGEIIVPKGTRLIGRVTEVQQKTKQSAMSRLGVVFERLEGKNLNAPVSATIVSITRATANASLGDTLNTDLTGGSTSSGTVSRGGSGGGGGGLLGGVTNTVGGVLNTTANAAGSVTSAAGQTLGGATQTLGKTVNGIQISPAATADAAGGTTLSAQNRDLRLEKGLTFQLKLAGSVEK